MFDLPPTCPAALYERVEPHQTMQGPIYAQSGPIYFELEDGMKIDGPFVMRVKMPDGYRVPPHTHPKPERVTVISGTLNIGMGDTFAADKCTAMPAGSFGTWPAGMKHFGWMKGETVLQMHGTGPWSLTYVNPKDDPRNQKE